MMSQFSRCFLFLLILTVAGNAVAADPPKKDKGKTTYTNPANTDTDFPIQGEYVGRIRWGSESVTVGLQVIALGDGKFDAMLHRGGLPGAGWDRGTREKLNGSRKDYGVQLVGYPGSLLLEHGRAAFYDLQGNSAGYLQRTERVSPTMGSTPPANAVVLFSEHDKNLTQFNNAKLTKEGYLHSGTMMKMPVGDFRLHLEFRTPYMPFAKGQSRGNSGVYIQQRYEVQILDSFGLPGEFNECGALYRQTPPDLNMCLPPLAWQTYDLYFTAARFAADGKTKTQNARLTLFHNGVAVHNNREIPTKTGAGKPEGPEKFPINIQDHGNPVALRNVWIVPADAGSGGEVNTCWQVFDTCQPCIPAVFCCPQRCR
jgi:hypothetical protein